MNSGFHLAVDERDVRHRIKIPSPMITPPIILQANDGISWWRDPFKLQCSIESPDIEAGLYAAWDSQGQVLDVVPVAPVVRSRFLGIETVSVTSGRLIETGAFCPDDLRTAILDHLSDVLPSSHETPTDLSAAVDLLCHTQPASDY